MNPTKRTSFAATVAAACLALAPLAGHTASGPPDGTVELSGGSVAVGVGVNWSKGTLHYQGKSYPISVKGLSVANVGIGSVTASGEVYHLSNVSDFAGNYAAVSAGAALAGGGSVSEMRNSNGVVIHLRATTQGVSLQLGLDGLKIALK